MTNTRVKVRKLPFTGYLTVTYVTPDATFIINYAWAGESVDLVNNNNNKWLRVILQEM